MIENETIENNEVEQLENEQTEDVSGGRRAIFHEINIRKDWCDFCKNKIDGDKRIGIPVSGGKKIMCSQCYDKQKSVLGQDAANELWLGIKPQSPTPFRR